MSCNVFHSQLLVGPTFECNLSQRFWEFLCGLQNLMQNWMMECLRYSRGSAAIVPSFMTAARIHISRSKVMIMCWQSADPILQGCHEFAAYHWSLRKLPYGILTVKLVNSSIVCFHAMPLYRWYCHLSSLPFVVGRCHRKLLGPCCRKPGACFQELGLTHSMLA